MKWRQAPDIDTEIIKSTKFLLIGAGTLGCHVSRNLLGWGARNINFIDNAKISFSNPVRQSLYNFQDSQEMDAYKADLASKRLKEIFPLVNSQGYAFTIRLPGRALVNQEAEEKYLTQVEQLGKLISEHDVIFLLTDTRESRWFPTFFAKMYNKICITSAIGFDSFVVIRHGTVSQNFACYFCSDIVSPVDSSSNRTLDQQCTISRPGISGICSGFCSEMAISLLNSGNSLGENIPHSIRGNIADFNFMTLQAQAFKQ
jgi:ubiquitin-like modifier-activating enzyme ATG7